MEKFVVLLGEHPIASLQDAIAVLKRKNTEEVDFVSTSTASVAIIHSPQDNYEIVQHHEFTILKLGTLDEPIDNEELIQLTQLKNNGKKLYHIYRGDATVLVINNEKKEFYICIEPWFRKLVYYSFENEFAIISNEMKAILATNPEISNRLDMLGVHCYITLYGFYGSGTLFQGIKIFQTGSINVFTQSSTKIIKRYDYPINYNFELDIHIHAKKLSQYFTKEVQKRGELGYNTVFLSGGLDSRMVLAAFNKDQRENLLMITLGNTQSSDAMLAKRVAKEAEVEFLLFETTPDQIITNAKRQAWISEGALFIGTSSTEFAAKEGNGMFLDGNPGDLSLGGTWANKLSKHKVGPQNEYYDEGLILGEPVGKSSIKIDIVERLYGKDTSKVILRSIYSLIQDEIDIYNFVENETLKLEYYALHNRWRRANHHIIREQANLLHPFLDDNFVLNSIIVPIDERSNRKLQMLVLEQLDPNLASVPSTSIIGLKKSRSIRLKAKNIVKNSLRKIPYIYQFGKEVKRKRIESNRPTEDSYLPMATWFRDIPKFRHFIIDILESFKMRNFVLEKVIDEMVEEHLSYKYNHMPFLARLTNLELVLQQLHDRKGFR